MNPNYAKTVKDNLEWLLTVGYIEPVDQTTWLFPIVVVPRKNGKLHICIDFRQLDVATKKDPYLLPFTNEVQDAIISYEAYSFVDGFSRYHEVRIHKEDGSKTTFITKWSVYVWKVMPFSLKNALPT